MYVGLQACRCAVRACVRLPNSLGSCRYVWCGLGRDFQNHHTHPYGSGTVPYWLYSMYCRVFSIRIMWYAGTVETAALRGDHALGMVHVVARGRLLLIVYTLSRVSGGHEGRQKGVRAHPSRGRMWGYGKEIIVRVCSESQIHSVKFMRSTCTCIWSTRLG